METQFQTGPHSERCQRGHMWKEGMGTEGKEGAGRTGCVEEVAAALWVPGMSGSRYMGLAMQSLRTLFWHLTRSLNDEGWCVCPVRDLCF